MAKAKRPAELRPYVLVRGDRSGVFVGEMERRDGREVRLLNSRRIWYWAGAASISQLAAEGTSRPTDCKFGVPVSETVLDAIEILDVTDAARASIEAVPAWRA